MEKIKLFLESEAGKDILIVIVVILVGAGSFELGRLSKSSGSSGIKIEYPNQAENQTSNAVSATDTVSNIKKSFTNNSPSGIQNKNSSAQTFFASSRGHKYYTLGCSAGKSIKEANKLYFNTSSEAEKAGYALSSSCK